MVNNLILLSLINAVVCERCPSGMFGEQCGLYCIYHHCFCNSFFDCTSCEAGYFNTSANCKFTCISPTCKCTNRENCHSCKDGSYGLENNCRHNCPTGCDSNACYNNGTCDTCKPNFSGSKCDSCIDGRYGANCSFQCSLGCAGKVCNSRNGTCNCRNYFGGEKCDSCVDGNYGENCSLKCSQGCEEIICNLRYGTCNCSSNYSGEQCENCIRDRYGEGCSKTCSLGCLENNCSSTDGKCDCKEFYTGDKCDVCRDGRYGDHCLNNIESRPPNKTNNFPTGALTGGVIGAVIVFDAAVVIAVLLRRRLSQREAQGYTDEQETTHPGGESTQPGQYETLNNSRIEEHHRSDTYTRLVTTGQGELTESVSPDNITMNVVGSDITQPGPYQTLNATHLKESNMNDTYTMLLVSGEAGVTERCNSESFQINHPTKSPECHSYANLMIKKGHQRLGKENTGQEMTKHTMK